MHIQPNYTYPYKSQSHNYLVIKLQPVYDYLLFYKSRCYVYSFELPPQHNNIML